MFVEAPKPTAVGGKLKWLERITCFWKRGLGIKERLFRNERLPLRARNIPLKPGIPVIALASYYIRVGR